MSDMATTARLVGISPPVIMGQWGQTTTTAADVATFVAAVEDAADAAMLLGLCGRPPRPLLRAQWRSGAGLRPPAPPRPTDQPLRRVAPGRPTG